MLYFSGWLTSGLQIQAGANAARSDDIKGLKGTVLDWITDKTHGLVPPIGRDEMAGRGFNHEATGRELCPAGLDWNDPEYVLAYPCVSAPT